MGGISTPFENCVHFHPSGNANPVSHYPPPTCATFEGGYVKVWGSPFHITPSPPSRTPPPPSPLLLQTHSSPGAFVTGPMLNEVGVSRIGSRTCGLVFGDGHRGNIVSESPCTLMSV